MRKEVFAAVDAMKRGDIVLVYDADGREEETDMAIASRSVTPSAIRTLRKDAGGLVCCTVTHDDAERIGLPFMVDVLDVASGEFPLLKKMYPDDIPYDTKSAFSLTLNHRGTRTGITDADRAMTISEIARMLDSDGNIMDRMGREFRSPGHVHTLIASKGMTRERQGHTELCTALAVMAGITPSVTICEMMGDDGHALPKDEARDYAKMRGFVYVNGRDIVEAFAEWSK